MEKASCAYSFEEIIGKERRLFTLSDLGGKGYNLCNIIEKQLNENLLNEVHIPRGFIVISTAFEEFIQQKLDTKQQRTVKEWLEEVFQDLKREYSKEKDISKLVNQTCHNIQQTLLLYPIPENVKDQIKNCLYKGHGHHFEEGNDILSESKRFAVRSSGSGEDLDDKSFAGQHDTYLNCVGKVDEISEAVKRCWISLFNERAISYRLYRNSENAIKSLPSMSVVVQEMVQAVSSGVMFTSSIMNNSRQIIVIEATHGLGEALVSGKVQPDHYKVKRTLKKRNTFDYNLEIFEKDISQKDLEIVSVESGGVIERSVEAECRMLQVLDDRKIIQVAEMGIDLEKIYLKEQDVEFAYDKEGKLNLLQSRPITSLYPVPKPFKPYFEQVPENESQNPIIPDSKYNFLFCFNHLQVMTDPIKPLGFSLLRDSVTKRIFGALGIPSNQVKERVYHIGGRIYLDLSHLMKRGFYHMTSIADIWMKKCIVEALNKPEASDIQPLSLKNILKIVLQFLLIFPFMIWTLFFRNNSTMKTYVEDQFDQILESSITAFSKQNNNLRECVENTPIFVGNFMAKVFRIGIEFIFPSGLAIKILKMICSEKLSGMVEDLMIGIKMKTSEMDFGILKLQNCILQYPELKKFLQCVVREREEKKDRSRISFQQLKQILLTQSDSKELITKAEIFMKEFGCRGYKEIDVTCPRYEEDCTMIIHLLANCEPHSVTSQQLEEKAELAIETFKDECMKETKFSFVNILFCFIPYFLKMILMKRMISVIRDCLQNRETPKHYMMKSFYFAKKCIQRHAELELKDVLTNPSEDIFYLTLDELKYLCNQIETQKHDLKSIKDQLKNLIESRISDFEKFEHLNPPRVITNYGENLEIIVHEKLREFHKDKNVLLGTGVSNGISRGKARVVLDPSGGNTLLPGEILIAKNVDPGYNPLFLNCTALVSEVGGYLTHGSVVAREMGFPAVVGILNATKLIKDGQQIEVDGTLGLVKLIEDQQ